MDALQKNDSLDPQGPGAGLEAIALLTEATRAAPRSSMAWGALAMAYATRKKVVDLPERPGLDARSRAAASRSLQIDPTEMRALGALRLLDPVYRNWAAAERADRAALAKNPTAPILLFVMSDMLGSVGRCREAASYSRRLDKARFLIPGAERKLVLDLWSAGDLAAADDALDQAVRQWPLNAQIWRTRMTYLIYTGRSQELLSVLRETPDRPSELKPEYFDAVRITAEALSGTRPKADAVAHALAYLRANPTAALEIAQAVVALGDAPAAFNILEGYYFGDGEWTALVPKGGDQDRTTRELFRPVMAPIWRDPRFGRLVQRIGLEDYWSASHTTPDFRVRP